MEYTGKVNIHNRFDIEVKDIVTGEVTMYEAKNIVLDAMWSRLVNFQTYFVNIHYGTGTGTFAASRTSLFTHKGTRTATTHETVKELPTSRWVRKIMLAPEEEVGTVFTEVGVAYGSTNTNLVTHAAIADAEGNPITLTKTDTQVLTIYATIFIVLGAADAMYGGKVRWVTPLANNELLSYLMGASYPSIYFWTGRVPYEGNGTILSELGLAGLTTVANWVKDAPNKKVTTPVRRFDVSTGNGMVYEIGVGASNSASGTFRAVMPVAGVYTGKAITGEAIGTGDGSKTGFNPTWNYGQSLTIKADGVAVNAGDYTTVPVKKDTDIFIYLDPQLLSGSSPTMPLRYITTPGLGNLVVPAGGITIGIDTGGRGGSSPVDRIVASGLSSAGAQTIPLHGSNNSDFSNSVFIANGATTANSASATTVSFTKTTYRYYTLTFPQATFTQVQLLSADDQITFDTAPALGVAITADYTVDYIPKDTNHVLDLQCSIQYGEPT